MESNDKIAVFHRAEALYKDELQSISETKGQLLAKKIELGMKEKHFNRQQFAAIMGVQPSIITRWLSGNHNFTVETLFEIEDKLGLKIIDIERPVHKKMNFHMMVGSEGTQHIASSLIEALSNNMHTHVTTSCTNYAKNLESGDDDSSFIEIIKSFRH